MPGYYPQAIMKSKRKGLTLLVFLKRCSSQRVRPGRPVVGPRCFLLATPRFSRSWLLVGAEIPAVWVIKGSNPRAHVFRYRSKTPPCAINLIPTDSSDFFLLALTAVPWAHPYTFRYALAGRVAVPQRDCCAVPGGRKPRPCVAGADPIPP